MSLHDQERASALPDDVTWEHVAACPLCASTDLVNWRQNCSDSTGLPGSLTYLRCVRCGCRLLRRRLDEASVGQLYPHTYGPYRNTAEGIDMSIVGAAGSPGQLRAALDSTYGQPGPDARVLDFGCGSAGFVDAARARGWRTVAADFTETGIDSARANGHEVRLVDDGFWAWLEGERFDVIRLSHVIEHLYEPATELRRFLAALSQRGQLHLITPNPEGPACMLARRHSNFFQWVHVTLIPPRALQRAAAAAGATGTDIVLEPTSKDLWRSWLLTSGRVRSYETAPTAPRSALAKKAVGALSRAFRAGGRADRYHAFIRV